MSDEEKKDIDPTNLNEYYACSKETYDWCAKNFDRVQDNFGLKVHVHLDDNTLEDGQIFLFNHFARFETGIPPYIFYKQGGYYTRTIAHAELFDASEKLSKFMRGGGAVPNNLPGLLPFLASEILRGRKVVIFPEGGMIKDRRVMDDSGKYGIFSKTAMAFRKHHRGAAILALTLDLFKRRIKDLHEDGDMERLERWRQSLELESVDELLKQANKPTNIVPGTITFYPIRVSDNIATKLAEFFVKKLPQSALEEIVIEGNILLKDTDMDIRFAEPIEIHKTWHWWERMLLKKYFLGVNSLDELFSLRHQADTWSEQLLAQFISKETDKIRDQYMEHLYDGVTVNLAHITATTITELMKQEVFSLPKDVFHKMIYISFKKLQEDPKVHLHSSFFRPRDYKNLYRGKSLLLKRNIRTNKLAGLIKEDAKNYYFQDKVLTDGDSNLVRMENPIKMRVNEIAPVTQVKKTILETIKKIDKYDERELALLMFDDEIRATAYNKELYSKKRHEEINKQETITESTDPYLLPQKKKAKKGVLLIHGFLSSPGELSELGIKLHKEGHAVLGMRVSGHGTSPWDLDSRTHEQWLGSVRRNYKILSAFCDEVYIIGFSGGGALALRHASTNPKQLAGVASVCTPLILKDKMMHLVPLLHFINKLFSVMPKLESLVPFRPNKSAYPKTNYATMPVSALNELRYLVQSVKKRIQYITCPVTILQATEDPVVNPKAANVLFKALNIKEKVVHMIDTASHGIIYDNIGETHKLLIQFVKDAKKATKNKDAS